jgi:DNA-binding NarL/FixJ family response regulator
VSLEPGKPLRVFVIEDSPLLRGMLGEMLDEIDCVVVVGEANGEGAALDRLASGEVDLAIVDLELNDGSGFGVLRRLRDSPERFGDARAVVFSTYAHHAVRQRCAQLGAEAFFDKADGLDQLMDFVERVARDNSSTG